MYPKTIEKLASAPIIVFFPSCDVQDIDMHEHTQIHTITHTDTNAHTDTDIRLEGSSNQPRDFLQRSQTIGADSSQRKPNRKIELTLSKTSMMTLSHD